MTTKISTFTVLGFLLSFWRLLQSLSDHICTDICSICTSLCSHCTRRMHMKIWSLCCAPVDAPHWCVGGLSPKQKHLAGILLTSSTWTNLPSAWTGLGTLNNGLVNSEILVLSCLGTVWFNLSCYICSGEEKQVERKLSLYSVSLPGHLFKSYIFSGEN